MTQPVPKRLLEDDAASAELRELLQAARADMPSDERLSALALRIAPLVGLAPHVLQVPPALNSVPPAAPLGQGSLAAASGKGVVWTKLAAASAGKWMSAAVLVGAGSWFVMSPSNELPLAVNSQDEAIEQAARDTAPPSFAGAPPEVESAQPVSRSSSAISPPKARKAAARPGPVASKPKVVPTRARDEESPPKARRPLAARPAPVRRPDPASRAPEPPPSQEISAETAAGAGVQRVAVPRPERVSDPGRERELITEAQAARGEHHRVLALVLEHAASYPAGALAQEREVLRLEALFALGRSSEASARLVAFERAYPGSAHLPQLHRLKAKVETH